MFTRIFTKEEADALLPELRRVLGEMRQAKAELLLAQSRLPEARGVERRALEEEIRFLMGTLEADARYLASLGVLLKDLDRGLVDFPARVGGEIVFLCWQEGEPEVDPLPPPLRGLCGAAPPGGGRYSPAEGGPPRRNSARRLRSSLTRSSRPARDSRWCLSSWRRVSQTSSSQSKPGPATCKKEP
jgi:hypothetical protein